MIRLIVRTVDIGGAAHVGGPVIESFKTFDIEDNALESHLREVEGNKWVSRQVIGIDARLDSEAAG